jgi:succinate-semialdehyde dehydrogenase/glutarate-semialdehyde dehydrogenase
VTRKLKAAGQACSAPNLVLAEGAVASEVADRIDAALRDACAGPSEDSESALGPVRSADAVDRLSRQAAALEAAGARRLGHGIAPPRPDMPFLAQPTAHLVAAPGAFLEQEMFGPLMGVVPVADREALAAILGANRHPLVLYVYGADAEGIAELTSGLRYGSIGINTTAIQSPDAPTGGFAEAGIGREGGPWGLREFLTTINLRKEGP